MSRFGRLPLIILLIVGSLMALTAVAGCGGESSAGTPAAPAPDPGQVLADRALKTIAATGSGEYSANSIKGADLTKKLADPMEKGKLYILDIRSKKDYDNGHVEGAVNMEWAKWADPANIKMLPAEKKIVVVCYTGNTAAQAAMGLRMLGYDAVALRAGMNGWTQTTSTQQVIGDLQSTSYPTATTPAGSTTPAPPPAPFEKPASGDVSILQDKAASIMASMTTSGEYANNTITAKNLSAKLANAADRERLFLVDVRSANDYNKGHIDGAVNIPFAAVAVPDNLKLIPKDKKIVVVCYTGNFAAQTVTVLKMLGYDAATLKFGMMAWNGNGKDKYVQDLEAANNPVVQTQQ